MGKSLQVKAVVFLIFSMNYWLLSYHATHLVLKYEDLPPLPYQFSPAWDDYLSTGYFSGTSQGLIKDYTYCSKVQAFQNSFHPTQNIQENRVIFSDYFFNSFVKEILNTQGRLVHRDHYFMSKTKEIEDLRPDITIFFHQTPNWHDRFKINSQFLCKNQLYNHIPGNKYLSFKDVIAQDLKEYQNYYKGRENCFDVNKTIPFTLVLTDEKQCLAFVEELKKPQENQWVYKKARESHNGQGVALIDKKIAEDLRKYYEEEKKCPDNEEFIAQKYISNPLLINNKKFDLRAYMLIASMDPLLILYHDGFLKFSAETYNKSSSNPESYLTNTQVAEDYLSSKNKTSELFHQSTNFQYLFKYLQSIKKLPNSWMDDVLRKKMKQTMLHIVRVNLSRLVKHPGVFELFGLDFLIDEDFNVWFFEVNLTPSIVGSSAEKKVVNKKLIEDVMRLEYARVFNEDFDEVFREVGSFEWVFDGRKNGYQRYAGVFEYECV